MKNIIRTLQQLNRQIHMLEQHYGRKPGSVGLLAVSKTRPVEQILAASQAGQRDFGENYLQEAITKIQSLDDHGLIWHFIGPVQANKTRAIAANFTWVHSLDREKIAQRLNAMRPHDMPPLNICVQVNISSEATKSGITPAELPELARQISNLSRLRLRGLMAMPEPGGDLARQRRPFRQLRHCFDQLNAEGYKLDTLSMGTTQDMEAAIAEGTTILRIGTAIFGPRSLPGAV
ncbi:MAG: YggS family pyridoxal phosphate-dependent enzyme [Gammaproteobacteria bacterium]